MYLLILEFVQSEFTKEKHELFTLKPSIDMRTNRNI